MEKNESGMPKDYYCELKTSCIIAWLEKQGQTFTKKDVDDVELRKWHMEGVHTRLSYYLFNYTYNKMGLKPISKCSVSELEAELNKRKEE